MWENIVSVITHLVSLIGTMTTALLNNELFQIVLGIVFFSIAMGIVFNLLKQIKYGSNKIYDDCEYTDNEMEILRKKYIQSLKKERK